MSLLVHLCKCILKPKDIFEFSEDKSRINLKCDHKNAISVNDYKPYTGNVMFSFKPIFDINQNKIDDKSYSYALIQYFYNFDISEDWKEIKYLDKNNQVTNFRVEDIDLNRRLHSKYKTIFYPNVSITHVHAKESYKRKWLLFQHIKSTIYYFNKYGWFFDKFRNDKNKEVKNSIKELNKKL